ARTEMKSVPPGRAGHARCGVLGRAICTAYERFLRPCIARTHRARTTSVIPVRTLNPRRTRLSTQKRREARRELPAVLVRREGVERMRRQRVLDQAPAPPEIHDRGDCPVGAVLNRDRTRVRAVAIDEIRERHDPVLANT